MSRIEEVYKPALTGKKIPTLTLDNKWHQLFDKTEADSSDNESEETSSVDTVSEDNEATIFEGSIYTDASGITTGAGGTISSIS